MGLKEFLSAEKVQKGILLISSFVVFFPFLQPLVYVLLAYFLLTADYSAQISLKSLSKKAYLLLILYFSWGLTSVLLSDNLSDGFQQLGKSIPFFLLALLFLSKKQKTIDFVVVERYYYLAAVIFVFSTHILVFYDYVWGTLQGQIGVYGKGYVDILAFLCHRTYASCLLLMTFPYLFRRFFSRSSLQDRLIALLSILVFTATIFVSGARVASVVTVLVILLLSFKYMHFSFSTRSVLFVVLTGVLLSSYFLSKTSRIEQLIYEIKNASDLSLIDDRAITWQAAIHSINSNMLLGVGVGDAQDCLNDYYIEKGYPSKAIRGLNAHNQYLQLVLERGLIGLFLLIAFFALWATSAWSKNQIYVICFLVVFGLNFMFESMLLRNLAIFPIVYWLLLLSLGKNKRTRESASSKGSNTIVGLLLFAVAVELLVLIKPILFDSNSPRTYTVVDYKELSVREMPSGHHFPDKTKAVCLEAEYMSFKSSESGRFMISEVYKFSDPIPSTVLFNLWCYVSEDSNLESVNTYIYNKNGFFESDIYDMSKKGTWQKLVIRTKNVPKYSDAGIRFNTTDDILAKGVIYYALPEILY